MPVELPEGFTLERSQSQGIELPPGFTIEISAGQEAPVAPRRERSIIDYWKDFGVTASNAAAFGFGDEAAAAIRAGLNSTGLDKILGRDFQTYDEELEAIRGGIKDFATDHPILSGAANVVGGLTHLSGGGMAARGSTFAGKAGLAAAEGAGLGAVYGFGEGEGGAQSRLFNAGRTGAQSALFAPAVVGAGRAVSAFGKSSQKAGRALNRNSIGARASDYRNPTEALETIALPDGPEVQTLTKRALDDLLDRNALGSSRNPSKMLAKVEDLQTLTGKEIQTVIGEFEEAGGRAFAPQFPRTLKLLEDGRVPAEDIDKYLAKLVKKESAINKEGLGQLSFLQQQKIALGTKYNPNDTIENAFNKAVYHDLQEAIEEAVPAIKPLNQEMQKLIIADKILRRGVAADDAKNLVTSSLQTMRTSGGVGVPALLASGATGGVAGGVPGALAGMVLGGYANSPRGRAQIGRGVRNAGLLSGGASKTIEALQPSASRGFAASEGAESSLPAQPSPRTLLKIQSDRGAGLLRPRETESFDQAPPAQNQQPMLAGADPMPTSSRPPKQELNQSIPSSNIAPISERIQGLMEPQQFSLLSRAVEAVESGGRADAVSSAGAIGTHQVMPIAMREVMRAQGIDDSKYTNAQLKEIAKRPGMSQAYGEEYLLLLIKKFQDPELALAAYNGGETRVRRLLKETGGNTFADIASRLPSETRQYVPKVRSALQRLQRRNSI